MPPDIIKTQQEEAQGIMYRTISDLQIGRCSMLDAQEKVDELVATIIANTGRELEARCEELDEYMAVKDSSSHRYQIPRSKKEEWDTFMEIPEDDERSWDVPEWAERIDGMPVSSFKDRTLTLIRSITGISPTR